MNKLAKNIETACQVAIIIVALVLSAVLVKKYLFPHSHGSNSSSEVKVGGQLMLPGVDLAKNKRTLMMVLSKDCRFCSESASFYRSLVLEKAKNREIGLIALFPHSVGDAQKYLSDLGVVMEDIRQVTPDVLRVSGTPTLILVDGSGIVQNIWLGKLPSQKEAEVLDELRRQS